MDIDNHSANIKQRIHDRDHVFAVERELGCRNGHPAILLATTAACKMAESDSPGDEHHVLAIAEGRSVEPAVAGLDREAGLL